MSVRECLSCHGLLPVDLYPYGGRARICQDCYDLGHATPELRRLARRISKAASARRSRRRQRLARLYIGEAPQPA